MPHSFTFHSLLGGKRCNKKSLNKGKALWINELTRFFFCEGKCGFVCHLKYWKDLLEFYRLNQSRSRQKPFVLRLIFVLRGDLKHWNYRANESEAGFF